MHGQRSLGRGVLPNIDNINQVRRLVGELMDRMDQGNPENRDEQHAHGPHQQEQQDHEHEGSVHGNDELGLTMGEYTLPFVGNVPTAIVLDDVARQYELKSMHIGLLPTFSGRPTEDCLQFMKQYGATLETFPVMARQTVLTREQLHLRCFQYCLKDGAMTWYTNLRPGSLTNGAKYARCFSTSSFRHRRRRIFG